DGLGHPARLVGVEGGRLARVDLAEVAAPGALVAADEERGLAVLPALEDVGAARLLADRVQAAAVHELLELGVLGAHGRPGADPLGLLLDRDLGVARLDPEHPASLGGDRHPARLFQAGTGCSARSGAMAAASAARSGGAASSTVTRRPSSAVSDVASASGRPQATMRENAERSASQLSARPCIVTPRATRTPIAASLRGRSPSGTGTQTPERPSSRTVARPSAAAASMTACSSART